MKRLTAILLVVLFALGLFGYYAFCAVQLYLAKESAREQILHQLPDKYLTKISSGLTKDQGFYWKEKGKEFSLNGDMYDVVKSAFENGHEYLFCISDSQEDFVLNLMDKMIQSSSSNTSGSGSQHSETARLFSPDWVLEYHNQHNVLSGLVFSRITFHNYKSQLYSGYLEVNAPPPNLLLLNLNKQL